MRRIHPDDGRGFMEGQQQAAAGIAVTTLVDSGRSFGSGFSRLVV
jgi:hypothetical protein